MAENEKRVIRLIKYWIVPNVIEAIILVGVYVALPKDPKNIWLLGFSKSRIFIMACILFYAIALMSLFFSLSNLSNKIGRALQKIKSRPSTNYSIEILGGVCLILLYFCGFYYFNVFQTDQIIAPIHLRLAPIVAYFSVFILQLFIFLVAFRLILSDEKLSPGNMWYCSTLPVIRQRAFEKMDAFITFTAENFSKTFLSTVFAITPAILTTAFIWMFFTTSIFSFMPNSSDQIDYWHETLTFVQHGFEGGQYSLHEIPAPAEFFRFGPHGPAYPILYGLVGKVIGWAYYSGVLINLLLITSALWIVILLGNLDKKQLVSGIILAGTFWPLLLYIPTNMAESLNQAFAIVLSVLFFKQISSHKNELKYVIPIFIILLVATMTRTTWSLLFIPFFLFTIFNYKGYKLWGAFIISGICILLGLLYTEYYWAPYPSTFRSILGNQLSIQDRIYQVWVQFTENIRNIIDEPDTPFFIQAFRYQIIGYAIYIFYKLIQHFRKEGQAIKKLVRSELGLHTANILLPTIVIIILNNFSDTRDYRVLSASFLLSALFVLFFSRYRYVYAIVCMNALLVFSFIPGFIQYRANNFIYDAYRIKTFKNAIGEYVTYDDTQNNRWCNTLGYQEKLNIALVTVDGGIGLSKIGGLSQETKSKYLLLDRDFVAESEEQINSLGLKRLVNTEFGILYLNPYSDCN